MVNVKAINDERLGRWKNLLNRKHSTPIIILAVGHDHHEGDLVVLTTEDRSDEETLLFMEGAVKLLREKVASQN